MERADNRFMDFDPEAPIPGLIDGKVKADLQAPIAMLDEDDDIRQEIFELNVRGYPPAAIVKRLKDRANLKITAVKEIIEAERLARSQDREKAGVMSIQDSISYYQRMKTEIEERAKYADDKSAPEFLKLAMEAQNRIDKLMGLEGEKAGKLPGDTALDGLATYNLRTTARVIRDEEDQPALGA